MLDDETGDAFAYDAHLGRWSRVAAAEFVAWLRVPLRCNWLDVACGTGALTQAILAGCAPARVDACDRSRARVEYARTTGFDPRASFDWADARELAYETRMYDAVVSGLPFPAIPDPDGVLAKWASFAAIGGVVGVYVWDLYGEMQILRYFWNVATALDAGADEVDAGEHFAICRPGRLAAALRNVGLHEVEVRAIDVRATFRDFDDYWLPFLQGNSPAQAHARSLSRRRRIALRERLRSTLPLAADGSLTLIARAWAAKGLVRE